MVADGLGGHSGGALAAQTVVETIEQSWRDPARPTDPDKFLKSLAHQCHDAVNAKGEEVELEPRSTLVALLVEGGSVTSVHAGDSRVMQFSGDHIVDRTIDHSIGQLSVLRGKIGESELATHPDQKKLFSHLGGESIPDLELKHWKLEEGARFVVCSDGFWEVFPPGEILELFESSNPERELTIRFSRKLQNLENHDNTSVILVDIGRTPSTRAYWLALLVLGLAELAGALIPHWEFTRQQSSPTVTGEAAPDGRLLEGPEMRSASTNGEERFVLAAQTTNDVRTGEGSQVASSETEAGAAASGNSSQDRHDQTKTVESQGNDVIGAADAAILLERVAVRKVLDLGRAGSVARVVADELRNTGRIGTDDVLEPIRKPGELNDSTLVRLNQQYKGISVYAAEVVATVTANRVVAVQGQIASGIEVEVDPLRSYAETISLATSSLTTDITPLDQGSTVIFRDTSGRDRVAWLGLVMTDRGQEQVIFDPETGQVLLRVPMNLGPSGAITE